MKHLKQYSQILDVKHALGVLLKPKSMLVTNVRHAIRDQSCYKNWNKKMEISLFLVSMHSSTSVKLQTTHHLHIQQLLINYLNKNLLTLTKKKENN